MPATLNGLESLTAKQRAVFDFVAEFIAANGYGPTIREIMDRFRYRSPNAVKVHLKPMRKKGLIDWKVGCARTLRCLVDPTE